MIKHSVIYWQPADTWPVASVPEPDAATEIFLLHRGEAALRPPGIPDGVRMIAGNPASTPLGSLLNRAVSESRGQTLVFLDCPDRSGVTRVEDFLEQNLSSLGMGLPAGAPFQDLRDHLARTGSPSHLSFLFGGGGRFCARRNCFAARAPFHPDLEAPLVWIDFAYRHAQIVKAASVFQTHRRGSAVHPLEGWAQGESRNRTFLSGEELETLIESRDSLDLLLSRRILAELHEIWARGQAGGSLDLLRRAEAIFRCARETIPARATFAFLEEQTP